MSKRKKTNPSATVATAKSPETSATRSPLFYAGVLAIIGAVLYLPTLGHGFVLDDPLVITLNQYVQAGFGGLADIFTHSYRAGSSVSTDSEYMYRPLSVAFFAIEWAVAPNTPGIHHFMNVIWYGLTIGLLFLTLRKMLGESATLMALGAALLFAIHPVHTEVVANIKSRDEILSFFFGLLTLYWLFEAAEGQSKKIFWALGAFLLALFAKEGAVTFIVIAPLALYFFAGKGKWRLALPLLGVFVFWYMIRFLVMGNPHYTPDFNDNPLVNSSLSERWATGFVVLGKYLKLLLWPTALSWDYSYNTIPVSGWGNPMAIVNLVLYGGLLGCGIWGIKRKNIWAFAALAFLASIGLYSNLFLMIGTIMGDRLVYQSSAWVCLAVAAGFAYFFKAELKENERLVLGRPPAFWGVLGVLGLLGAVATLNRNPAWESNYTLVTTDVKTVPGSFRVQQAVGEETLLRYVDKATPPADTARLLAAALDGFDKAYSIRPTFNNALGKGNVAFFRKNYPLAVTHFEEALQLNPANTMARERLATTYNEWGRFEGQVKNNLPKAIECLKKSYDYDSTTVQVLRDLGTVYGISQQPDKAVIYLGKALKIDPTDQNVRRNLALSWQQLGQQEKAAAVLSGQ